MERNSAKIHEVNAKFYQVEKSEVESGEKYYGKDELDHEETSVTVEENNLELDKNIFENHGLENTEKNKT